MYRLLQFLIIFLVMTVSFYFWTETRQNQFPAKKFSNLWQKDLDYLSALKGFPEWQEIKSVSFISGNRLARSFLLQAPLPRQITAIKNTKKSKFNLEIVVVAWNDAKETGIVLQYELLDSKTRNKQWEFSRTLIF